jgi:hypothetical protein
MDEPGFRALIHAVADNFQSRRVLVRGIPRLILVTSNAREELIRPGLPHLADITRGIQAGTILSGSFAGQRITVPLMQDAVRRVLDVALEVELQRPMSHVLRPGGYLILDVDPVLTSLQGDCPYVFWC